MKERINIPPMVRELLTNPRWRARDLGEPIPASEHAISVCLPTWRDNVGYEEEESRVMERVQIGYPRFIYHLAARALFERCRGWFPREGDFFQVYASTHSAERCLDYVRSQAPLPVSTRCWTGLLF